MRMFTVNLCFVFFLNPSAGGPWLITDMERIESVFELEPSLQVSFHEDFHTAYAYNDMEYKANS